MNSCRVARRVALSTGRQSACAGAGKRARLATKDMHCSVQFSCLGRRADLWLVVAAGEQPSAVGRLGRGAGIAGVPLLLMRRVARRVAWPAAPVLPPCISVSLVTKERERSDET